jgi:hypothetical protein
VKVWVNIWSGAQITGDGVDGPSIAVEASGVLGVYIYPTKTDAEASCIMRGGIVLELEPEQLKPFISKGDGDGPMLSSLDSQEATPEYYALGHVSMVVHAAGGERSSKETEDSGPQCEGWFPADDATNKWIDELAEALGQEGFVI